jgi:hypothetical protein
MAISFNTASFADGQVADGDPIKANFALINTFLAAGISNTYIANKYHQVCVTINLGTDDITAGSTDEIIRGFKVPASSGDFVHVETTIMRTSPTGQFDVSLHDSYADADSDSDIKVGGLLIANGAAAGTTDTSVEAATFAAGTSIFVRMEATTANVGGAQVTMFFKSENRS